MFRNIRMIFHFSDKDKMNLITIMIRPKMEYAEVVWSLYKNNIGKLERL